MIWHKTKGLVQDCIISIANALEILQSCIMPSVWLGCNWIGLYGLLSHQPQAIPGSMANLPFMRLSQTQNKIMKNVQRSSIIKYN